MQKFVLILTLSLSIFCLNAATTPYNEQKNIENVKALEDASINFDIPENTTLFKGKTLKNVTFTKQVQGLFDGAILEGPITFKIEPTASSSFKNIKPSNKNLQIEGPDGTARFINTETGKLEKS